MTEYLTTKEAAKVARASQFTMNKWIREGKIKAVRPTGGKNLIEKAELERFLSGDQLKAN